MPLFGGIELSKVIFERIYFQQNNEEPDHQDGEQNDVPSPSNLENVENQEMRLPKIICVIPNNCWKIQKRHKKFKWKLKTFKKK